MWWQLLPGVCSKEQISMGTLHELLCASEIWGLYRSFRISKGTFWADGRLRYHQGRTEEDETGRKVCSSPENKTKSATMCDSGLAKCPELQLLRPRVPCSVLYSAGLAGRTSSSQPWPCRLASASCRFSPSTGRCLPCYLSLSAWARSPTMWWPSF